MNDSDNDSTNIQVVYDGECPICRYYCEHVTVAQSHGSLELVDARKPSSIMDEINANKLDIDQGMVVKQEGKLYYGAEAIHRIANLGTRTGWFNRMNRILFKSWWMARILYPVSRSVRNLFLKLLRKNKINNLHKSNNLRF